jgi:hypothetical protein
MQAAERGVGEPEDLAAAIRAALGIDAPAVHEAAEMRQHHAEPGMSL